MKVAAVQMEAVLADTDKNTKRAEGLAEEAFAIGCRMVILPEFFTSAVAFHPDMSNAAQPFEGPVLDTLASLCNGHHDGTPKKMLIVARLFM